MLDNSIPQWASDVFIENRLGFESLEVRQLLWGYFTGQFRGLDYDDKLLKTYFQHYLSDAIKKGYVELAIAHVRSHARPANQEALVLDPVGEIEEKFANHLVNNGNSTLTPKLKQLSSKDRDRELLLEAYYALCDGDDMCRKPIKFVISNID